MVGHLPSVLEASGGGWETAVQLHCVDTAYKVANHTPKMLPLYDSCGKLCEFVVAAALFVC